MTSSDPKSTQDESEIDLAALWHVVWDRKYAIAGITALFGAAAVFLAVTAVSVYRAEVVVTEVRSGAMSGGGSVTGQLGGLASLVGVNLGGRDGEAQQARAILNSRRLIEEFIQRHDLLPVLLSESKEPPIMWFAVQRFRGDVLSIRDDDGNGTTTVAMDWTDPAIAASWANDFVALANEVIRARAMNDSKKNIAYLSDEITRTNVVEVQRVMYNLIETETKTLMVANGRVEYAFSVIDPAVPPQVRIRPRRTVMVLLGIAVGFFLGMVMSFAHEAIVRNRRDPVRSR